MNVLKVTISSVLFFPAYMYLDLSIDEETGLPEQIREKYTLTKTLGRLVLS